MGDRYTGGVRGWGTLIYTCPVCGKDIAEWETDDDGRPTNPIWDESETHACSLREMIMNARKRPNKTFL